MCHNKLQPSKVANEWRNIPLSANRFKKSSKYFGCLVQKISIIGEEESTAFTVVSQVWTLLLEKQKKKKTSNDIIAGNGSVLKV